MQVELINKDASKWTHTEEKFDVRYIYIIFIDILMGMDFVACKDALIFYVKLDVFIR